MRYTDIKQKVLKLINQYSIAGETISVAYNNQADYISRIPGLINDALLRIRTEARPNIVTCSFRNRYGDLVGDMRRHILPDKYRGIKTGGVFRIHDGKFEPFAQYRLLGNHMILFPDDDAEYTVEYYCASDYLSGDLNDDYDLEEDPEVLSAACYYAAAMLALDKNEYQYAALYNEFLRRMEGMTCQPMAEISTIVDVYG